jgi:psp operon transcriptional activator
MSNPIDSNIGESEVYLKFQRKISAAAQVNRSVLVVGERGSGKELAASRLHYLSKRWGGPLITVNCAALPPSLIESELFGYAQGAFTGAQKTRKGRFEEADGGTLFLDEIGLIPMEVQEKILRVVEYGTFEKVGSSTTQEVNVRLIGATNADLPQLCKEGRFKEDLLDRLSFEVLFVPPLRYRGDDILLLANFFASKMALECGIEGLVEFSEPVKRKMLSYSWPGNVRELKNTVERAVYRTAGPLITDIETDPFDNPYMHMSSCKEEKIAEPVQPAEPIQASPEPSQGRSILETYPLDRLDELKNEAERTFLNRALEQAQGNQKQAAQLMGLTYDQFRGLYRKHGK